jgi:hypothetical protein
MVEPLKARIKPRIEPLTKPAKAWIEPKIKELTQKLKKDKIQKTDSITVGDKIYEDENKVRYRELSEAKDKKKEYLFDTIVEQNKKTKAIKIIARGTIKGIPEGEASVNTMAWTTEPPIKDIVVIREPMKIRQKTGLLTRIEYPVERVDYGLGSKVKMEGITTTKTLKEGQDITEISNIMGEGSSIKVKNERGTPRYLSETKAKKATEKGWLESKNRDLSVNLKDATADSLERARAKDAAKAAEERMAKTGQWTEGDRKFIEQIKMQNKQNLPKQIPDNTVPVPFKKGQPKQLLKEIQKAEPAEIKAAAETAKSMTKQGLKEIQKQRTRIIPKTKTRLRIMPIQSTAQIQQNKIKQRLKNQMSIGDQGISIGEGQAQYFVVLSPEKQKPPETITEKVYEYGTDEPVPKKGKIPWMIPPIGMIDASTVNQYDKDRSRYSKDKFILIQDPLARLTGEHKYTRKQNIAKQIREGSWYV